MSWIPIWGHFINIGFTCGGQKMNVVKSSTSLSGVLKYFSEANEMRPTRMGVFVEGPGATIDYWLEDGLPLAGIDVERTDGGKVSVQVLLSNKEGTEKSHFTRVINNVWLVKLILSNDGESDGLDIVGFDGNTTILRFENFS